MSTIIPVQNVKYHSGCTTYASLTKIARDITGAQWSGPRFFGLTKTPASARSGGDTNGDESSAETISDYANG